MNTFDDGDFAANEMRGRGSGEAVGRFRGSGDCGPGASGSQATGSGRTGSGASGPGASGPGASGPGRTGSGRSRCRPRLAIYERLGSSALSAQASRQRRENLAFVASLGGTIDVSRDVFSDDRRTAASGRYRGGLEALLREVHAGRFDGVVVHDVSRLVRNRAEWVTLRRILVRAGCELHVTTCPSLSLFGPVGELLDTYARTEEASLRDRAVAFRLFMTSNASSRSKLTAARRGVAAAWFPPRAVRRAVSAVFGAGRAAVAGLARVAGSAGGRPAAVPWLQALVRCGVCRNELSVLSGTGVEGSVEASYVCPRCVRLWPAAAVESLVVRAALSVLSDRPGCAVVPVQASGPVRSASGLGGRVADLERREAQLVTREDRIREARLDCEERAFSLHLAGLARECDEQLQEVRTELASVRRRIARRRVVTVLWAWMRADGRAGLRSQWNGRRQEWKLRRHWRSLSTDQRVSVLFEVIDVVWLDRSDGTVGFDPAVVRIEWASRD